MSRIRTGTPVGPRASKEEFLRAIGISRLENCEELYKTMRVGRPLIT